MLLEAKVDGIRADVAPIKPYEFWKELIDYTRAKDSEFMFLAETAEAWAPPKVPTPTANYVKLLEAGFDGYYGNCLNYLNFKSSKDFEFIFKHINKLAKEGTKKSIIGCFDTHDLKSAYITSPKYATAIMYMNATLPLNPYYVDGFQSGDKYDYPYANKKAKISYTDSDTYKIHENQLDIFNFSRRPGGDLPKMKRKLKKTIALRKELGDIVTKGSFKMLKTSDKSVFAYERFYKDKGVIVIVNSNHNKAKFVTVYTDKEINEIKSIRKNSPVVERGRILDFLGGDDISVITFSVNQKDKK
jgi:glycosidase